ncbi:Putative competence-damage inducible protein [Corynebacterium capitovis DSM 44611]|uniref:CinA family protein n=1 Tax=Corynebacterium capitovis TaxID=131081 RepID=UPI00035DC914|nr:CinA family protein [Corynebacterium capitovis]WKD58115.1 Putative competence-damage inducible protein [Corynebacterium capitovis DSM 44611]
MPSPDADDLSVRAGRAALDCGWHLAAAESLTGGSICSALGAAPFSAEWFAGGVVAYESRVKYDVLGVPEGHPVITEEAATAMAAGVAHLLGADASVAVTGSGGPDPQEGHPPGTVWIAVYFRGDVEAVKYDFDGEPEEVVEQTRVAGLTMLAERLEREVRTR